MVGLWGAFKGLTIMGKLGVILAILAAIGAIIFGINRWLDGIRDSGRNEVKAQWAAADKAREAVKGDTERAIVAAMAPQFDRLATQIGNIDTKGADINVRLPQAIAAAPRYRDPGCALTQPVLDQINAARALSASTEPKP